MAFRRALKYTGATAVTSVAAYQLYESPIRIEHLPHIIKQRPSGEWAIVYPWDTEPRVGSLVLCRCQNDPKKILWKRVMGVEGEMVVSKARNKAWRIPKGYFFLAGKDPMSAEDSREFGPLPKENIIGTVMYSLFPPRSLSRTGRGSDILNVIEQKNKDLRTSKEFWDYTKFDPKNSAIVPTLGDSMLPTLEGGDKVVVYSLKSDEFPDVGHVVGCASPESKFKSNVVKRVVGVQGEVIYSKIRHKAWKIPPGYIFLAGDNTQISHDSRHYGPVPREMVLYTAKYRIRPSGEKLELPLTGRGPDGDIVKVAEVQE